QAHFLKPPQPFDDFDRTRNFTLAGELKKGFARDAANARGFTGRDALRHGGMPRASRHPCAKGGAAAPSFLFPAALFPLRLSAPHALAQDIDINYGITAGGIIWEILLSNIGYLRCGRQPEPTDAGRPPPGRLYSFASGKNEQQAEKLI